MSVEALKLLCRAEFFDWGRMKGECSGISLSPSFFFFFFLNIAHNALHLRTEGKELNANTFIDPCTSPRGAKKHSPVYLKSS